MSFLRTPQLMLLGFIFIYASSKVDGETLKCVECLNRPSNFPSKRDAGKDGFGIWFGFCDINSGDVVTTCSKKSDRCVTLEVSEECSSDPTGELRQYFPKSELSKGRQIKGCWNDKKSGEFNSMISNCGGRVDFVQKCSEDGCNSDPPVSTV